jgi:chemotaxis protein methyltransferase CheR
MDRTRYPFLSDPQTFDISDAELETIRLALAERTGFRLEGYKDKCVKRRITLRIRSTQCHSVEEYLFLLQQNKHEVENLCRVLTIHVSHFFRNPPTFKKLEEVILPDLFSRVAALKRDSITIWSVGCASGEEPYSLALILKDRFSDYLSLLRVEIIGTDLDERVLAKARNGIYGTERLVEVPAGMLDRYFHKSGDCYRLDEKIRDMVTFCRADLFSDPTYRECDIILCRNVLIYFERPQQEAILTAFANVLSDNGLLVLGKSETLVGEARKRFLTVCPTERIYRVTPADPGKT